MDITIRFASKAEAGVTVTGTFSDLAAALGSSCSYGDELKRRISDTIKSDLLTKGEIEKDDYISLIDEDIDDSSATVSGSLMSIDLDFDVFIL